MESDKMMSGRRRVKFESEHDDRWDSGGGDYNSGGRRGGGVGGNRWRGGNSSRGGRGHWRGGGEGRGGGGHWRSGGHRRGGRGRGRGGRNARGGAVTYPLDDDDVEMGDFDMSNEGEQRYGSFDSEDSRDEGKLSVFERLDKGGSGRPGRGRAGNSSFGRLHGLGGSSSRGANWHKVSIPGGGNHSREWLLRQLQNSINEPFKPVQVHAKEDRLMFFVEESRAANQLRQLASIDTNKGSVNIYVKPSPPPKGIDGDDRSYRGSSSWKPRGEYRGEQSGRYSRGGSGTRGGIMRRSDRDGDITMEEDPSAALLEVLGTRYNTFDKALDLSNMSQVLEQSGIRGNMFDHGFVNTILDQINQHCPDLQALDLSSNRLLHLRAYKQLRHKCPNLKKLVLSDNQLHSFQDLEAIGSLPSLVSLVLENNPMHNSSKDSLAYASSIRKFFPGLQELDGNQLPGPIKFDLPVDLGALPLPKENYLVNDEIKALVIKFLDQYYALYDGDSREKLLEAYGDNAVFSMVADSSRERGPSLQPYFRVSRNLAQVTDPVKKSSLLKHGRIDIVQCLRDLPKTKHISHSFNVDVFKATPMVTAFMVHGVFCEVGMSFVKSDWPVRAFTRTFVIMASGTGVAIINDQLIIRNASYTTVQEIRRGFEEEIASLQQQQQPAPLLLGGSPSQQILAPAGLSSSQDEQVLMFAQETAMNLQWSKKCLAENEWNSTKALTAFRLFNSRGQIPAEAFQS